MSDIQALFQEDPLKLTHDDYAQIIAYYREKRIAFNLGDKAAGATKKMKSVAPGEKVRLSIDEILSDM